MDLCDDLQRIAVDRRNYELGLNAVSALPHEELADIVKAICRELDLKDIANVLPSM